MLHVIALEDLQVVQLAIGDTLRLVTTFGYKGPQQQLTLYAAIGSLGFFGFDEILVGQASIDLPESLDEFTPCEYSVDIRVTADISSGIGYDLMAKIKECQSETEVRVENVIDITGNPPSPWTQMLGSMLPLMMMLAMVSLVSKAGGSEEGAETV